ncbi:hypothetical protein JCM6882_002329 [Rhodosporidiobolus microsporus]
MSAAPSPTAGPSRAAAANPDLQRPGSPSRANNPIRGRTAAGTVSQEQGSDDGQPRKKRKKTLRACDHCRDKRLRCDWIPDVDPALCFECRKRKIACERVLPARVDSRKLAKLEAAEAAGGHAFGSPASLRTSTASPAHEADQHEQQSSSSAALDLLAGCVDHFVNQGASSDTSIAQLLAEIQQTAELHALDAQFGHAHASDGSVTLALPRQPFPRPSRGERLTSSDIVQMIQHYMSSILPLFPIFSPDELQQPGSLSPSVLLGIAVVMAASRRYPFLLFDNVRGYWGTAVQNSDVFTTSSFSSLQALLLMSMSSEPHGATASDGGSTVFLRTGLMYRMAHDLGLHHAPPSNSTADERNARMRLWLCCVISDRWYSASFGHPPALNNVDDGYDYFVEPYEQDPYLVQLYRLSELLNRALRALERMKNRRAVDEDFSSLLLDFDGWLAGLSPELQFAGPESSQQGGLLHLYAVAFESILLRPFIKQDNPLANDIRFRPTPARWYAVVLRSRSAIEWFVQHGVDILDTWNFSFYALMMAASVQFFAHVKSGQIACLHSLEAVKNALQKYAEAIDDGPYSTRQKIYKISALLFQAASRRHQPQSSNTTGPPTPTAPPPLPRDPSPRAPLPPTPARDQRSDPVNPFALPPLDLPPHPMLPELPQPVPFAASAAQLNPSFQRDEQYEFSADAAFPLATPQLAPVAEAAEAAEAALPDQVQGEWQAWCDNLFVSALTGTDGGLWGVTEEGGWGGVQEGGQEDSRGWLGI